MATDNHRVTLVDILKHNASSYPDKLAYTFLSKDKKETLSNKELLQKMIDIATRLLSSPRKMFVLQPNIYIDFYPECMNACDRRKMGG